MKTKKTPKKPRLGILAYATDTGLGIQTRNIYRFLKPAKTMLVDLSNFNQMPVKEDWYDYDIKTQGFPTKPEIDKFLNDLDVVLVCETPLNYYLFEEARRRGIVTILQYNFEFLDYFQNKDLPQPSVFAAPTLWNIKRLSPTLFHRVAQLPVPIDVEALPQRKITEAKRFLHIAGRPAAMDRNGTLDFIAAAQMSGFDAEFIVACQNPTEEIKYALSRNPKIKLIDHIDDYTKLYEHGDVLVLPRKYGGLCLPAQEAIGSGMPVIMTDVDPNNKWLPRKWLVPVKDQHKHLMTRCPIEVYQVNPLLLAQKMSDFFHNPDFVESASSYAHEIAQMMSWEAQIPKYETFMEGLCHVR